MYSHFNYRPFAIGSRVEVDEDRDTEYGGKRGEVVRFVPKQEGAYIGQYFLRFDGEEDESGPFGYFDLFLVD